MEEFGSVEEALRYTVENLITRRNNYIIDISTPDAIENEQAATIQVMSQDLIYNDGEAGLTLHLAFDASSRAGAFVELKKLAATSIYKLFDEYTLNGIPCFGLRFGTDVAFAGTMIGRVLSEVYGFPASTPFRCRVSDEGRINRERTDEKKSDDSRSTREFCRRLLLMVQCLHQMGYGRLRITPGLASSGLGWRCELFPSAASSAELPMRRAVDCLSVCYSSADKTAYFGWTDAAQDSPEQLAQKFVQRFPEIATRSLGSDSAYVCWFSEMIDATQPEGLPFTYAEWRQWPDDRMPVIGMSSVVDIPLPPPPERL